MSGKLVYIDSVEQALNKAYGEGNPLRIGRILNNVSAVDAVEVIRCKDCMMFCPQSGPIAQHCFVTGNVVSDDDFCSFGERREENE